MRCVVVGKQGQLGKALIHVLKPHCEIVGVGRSDVDLSQWGALQHFKQEILDLRPDVLFNAAAYTLVDQAEDAVAEAMMVNAVAPRVMAEAMREVGGRFVHFSTDYVFDGAKRSLYTEQDFPAPINVYGASKLSGETLVAQLESNALVFRTSWVYDWHNPRSFVAKVLSWASQRSEIRVVDDQVGSPTPAWALAEWMKNILGALLSNRLGGIYHCAVRGAVSRYHLAQAILEYRPNLQHVTVLPASTNDFPTKARRPAFSALDVTLFETHFDIRLPNWREALERELAR